MVYTKVQKIGLALPLLATTALSPRKALACAVCYNPNAAPGLSAGLTWGLVILITATFAIVASLFVAVIKLERAKVRAEGA